MEAMPGRTGLDWTGLDWTGLDYHIDVERHYYSVLHQLIKQKLWVRITASTVEIIHKDQRVAAPARSSGNRQHSTHRDHMPTHHRYRENWTPERIRRKAARIGPNTEDFVEVVMRQRKHPEQGCRTCLGTMRLAKTIGRERLEAACDRALQIKGHSYTFLHSIKGTQHMLNHPTLDQLQTLKLDGMAEAFSELQTHTVTQRSVMRNGWACSSIAKRPAARQNVFESRMHTVKLHHGTASPEDVDWTRLCSSNCSPTGGSKTSAT